MADRSTTLITIEFTNPRDGKIYESSLSIPCGCLASAAAPRVREQFARLIDRLKELDLVR